MLTSRAFRLAALFAAAGALSRFSFRTFETRWQILIFWAVVVAYQFGVRPLMGRRVSPRSAVLDAVTVAVAIVVVKVAIEGTL
ncbi:MAG: hypothetical protein ACRYFW_16070 [Janthinobacterium lividum]